jgi:predicted membrane chloride channel (bestrophin family)
MDDLKVWELPEFRDLVLELPDYDSGDQNTAMTKARERYIRTTFPKEMYVMGQNLKSDLNLRVPIRVAQHTRNIIMKHQTLSRDPLNPMQEMRLLDTVKDFSDSYRNIRKYLVAPLPLPWVQLGRLFVLAYVFTLPFALLSADLNLKSTQVVFLLVVITYGFVGCELLFVELDGTYFRQVAVPLPTVFYRSLD